MPAFMDNKLINADDMGVLADILRHHGSLRAQLPAPRGVAGFALTLWNRLTLDTFFLAQWGHWLTDLQASYMVQEALVKGNSAGHLNVWDCCGKGCLRCR